VKSKYRRLFLKTLAAFSTLGAVPFYNKKLRAAELSNISIIVVGSGVSGLAAAKSLAKMGAQVTVLEAKNRYGGRLYTDYSLGVPFELGAGWIHGASSKNPIKKLTDRIGAKTFVTDDDNQVLFNSNGMPISDADFDKLDEKWEEILEAVENDVSHSDSRSLAKIIEEKFPGILSDLLIQWSLSAYTEFDKGAAIENLSARYFNEDEAFPGVDVIVVDGFDKILKLLTDNLKLLLNTPVTKIVYGGNGVEVIAGGKKFTADYVLCSVSLGVLKRKQIKFDPPLPNSYQRKIDKLGFGSVTKIAIKFSKAFWDPDVQYFSIATETKGRWVIWLNYRTFSKQNILLGISVGDYAITADKMNDKKLTADAIDALKTVWGDTVGKPVKVLRTHWSTDFETLGAYSYPTPTSVPSDFDSLAEGISGSFYKTLFLCGEHTTFDYSGTLHGAYFSGVWAAELIAEEEEE